MADAMLYEPDYGVDVLASPELGVVVGVVALDDPRPQAAEGLGEADLIVAGAGEAVIDGGSPAALALFNARCVGPAAAEAAVVYAQSGVDGLSRLSGSCAGLIIDRPAQTCVLFTDRFGSHRIFHFTDGERTFFSSEAKAILAVAPGARAINERALAEWMACGGSLGTHSLFRHIGVPPAATALVWTGRLGVSQRQYFDRAMLEQMDPVPDAEFVDRLSHALLASVHECFARPPRAAISLTGGLDSRMIMACLEAPRGAVPCYTFGSMYQETYDVRVGRQVAAIAGQPHSVLMLDTEFLSGLRQTFDESVYASDGYIGLSGAAELYLNRKAKRLAPVRVTGNWGGEMLRGVRAFKYLEPRGEFLRPPMLEALRDSAAAFDQASRSKGNPLSYTLFEQMPVQGHGRSAIERSQVRMRAPFLRNDVVECLYRASASARKTNACSEAVIRRAPELLRVPTDLGLLGRGPAVIRRLRTLHRKGVSRAEYVVSHGAPNWMAVLTASNAGERFERLFLGRHKFQHFRRWMRRELEPLVRDTLCGPEGRELDAWFDRARVRAMVDDHIAGRANYTDEIDKLMTVVVLTRTLLTPRFAHAIRRQAPLPAVAL
jgi:asparagine synthase (glutamine-hydrolysing)